MECSSTITCKTLIIVEGKGDCTFLAALLRYMDIKVEGNIQFKVLEGEDKYRTAFPALLNDPGFSQLTAYAYIRDADKAEESALQSVQRLLKSNSQPCPERAGSFAIKDELKVGIFIMPGRGKSGSIEDLCLESVQDHAIMPYVKEYMDKVKQTQQQKAPKHPSKAKVQAFLSGMPKVCPHLGQAASQNIWNFNHEAFMPLRRFLCELMQAIPTSL